MRRFLPQRLADWLSRRLGFKGYAICPICGADAYIMDNDYKLVCSVGNHMFKPIASKKDRHTKQAKL